MGEEVDPSDNRRCSLKNAIFAMNKTLKNELYNVLSGKSAVSFGTSIQAITRYLGDGVESSSDAQIQKQFKKQEEERLIQFIELNQLWINDIDFSKYVSEGAEQKVFLNDERHVIELNDTIYYPTWLAYFQNLLLHNYFFFDTSYELLGFTTQSGILYAIVSQKYVISNSITNLEKVKTFLEGNGFKNIRNNDYFNEDLGIILEDLHDENVLTKDDTLYFIDTVFYTTKEFWKI